MPTDICEVKDCNKKATKLAAPGEGGMIEVCGDCYYQLYKV